MSLYDEALVDAQKLREVAENAAKQQILESITPRIREMINSRILFEAGEDPQKDEDFSGDFEEAPMPEDEDVPDEGVEFEDVSSEMSLPEPSPSQGDMHGKKSPSVVINNTGDIHIDSDDEDLSHSLDVREGAENIIERAKGRLKLAKSLMKLDEQFSNFKRNLSELQRKGAAQGQKEKLNHTYRKLVGEAVSLKSDLDLLSCGGGTQRLERKLISTLKEMRTMSNRTKKNIFDFLFEGEDNVNARRRSDSFLYEADDAEEGGKPEEGDKEDVDLDKIKDLVTQLQDALGGEGDEGGEEPSGEELDLDLGPEEDEDEEKDEGAAMDEMSHYDEGYAMDEMGSYEEGYHMDERDDNNEMHGHMEETVYEIDESALRRELGKMKSLRESRQKRSQVVLENAAEDQADQFGGGEALGDVFYDIDEDKLINVLADELGSVKTKPHSVSKNESTEIRRAMQEAASYKQAAHKLQSQLVEMNLFNAKLLYANKLMQNKNLTLKQQRAIVEALDNAKTLREAKLLYKSLSESLARRGQASGNLSESVNRTVGSSSRSTRSAQPASSGVEVDRWAVLAGIKG